MHTSNNMVPLVESTKKKFCKMLFCLLKRESYSKEICSRGTGLLQYNYCCIFRMFEDHEVIINLVRLGISKCLSITCSTAE